MQKPIRPAPKGPHKVEFRPGAAAILVASEDGHLRRYLLEDFPEAWHPHRLPRIGE
jgi:hypothetical protein